MSKKTTDQTLNKCNELIERLTELKKAISGIAQVPSNRKPIPHLGVGWSQDPGTGSFHHSTHGVITTSPHPEGGYEIKHNGGVVGRVNNMNEAGAHIRSHVNNLGPRSTNMYNRQSPNVPGPTKMGKPLTKTREYTPEQKAAIEEARKLRNTAESAPWVQHSRVPNADQELAKLNKNNPTDKAENLMANQLANMMAGKAMLGQTPPRQPTDQEMFGHLVPSEEALQKAEASWANKMNWLEEAMKPIGSKFASEAEEIAYWDSIKVSDRDDGKSGY